MNNYVPKVRELQRENRAKRIIGEEISYRLEDQKLTIKEAAAILGTNESTLDHACKGKLELHLMFRFAFFLGVCERELIHALMKEKETLAQRVIRNYRHFKHGLYVNGVIARKVKQVRKQRKLTRQQLATFSEVPLWDVFKLEWGFGCGGYRMLAMAFTLQIDMNQLQKSL